MGSAKHQTKIKTDKDASFETRNHLLGRLVLFLILNCADLDIIGSVAMTRMVRDSFFFFLAKMLDKFVF